MDLDQYGDPPIVQPVEHVHAPQRARSVERHAGDVGNGLLELATMARGGQHHAAHVIVEIEVRILDPDRMVEAERDFHHPPPEGR